MKYLVLLLLAADPVIAAPRATPCDPATPDNALCITGTAPTVNTDGTPITLPLIYRIEQKTGTGAYATVATGLTSLQYYAKNLAPGDYVFRAYANCVGVPSVVNCSENSTPSPPSSVKNIAVPTVTPGAPLLIIAVTINAEGPPTYRLVYTARPRVGEFLISGGEDIRALVAKR